jgi:hypothetical protein
MSHVPTALYYGKYSKDSMLWDHFFFDIYHYNYYNNIQ